MGAAEWTGCYSSTASNTTAPAAYSSYYHHHTHPNHHHHHPHHTQHHHAQMPALPPPPPPPAATNSTMSLTHAYGGYDTSALAADHANFHIPTVISDMQPFCASSDYHAVAPHAQTPICSPTYASSKTDMELNTPYPAYNNWSNGYNNYQQPQYAPTAPTMVLCPQLYSVNQNQIHLHVHSSSDKIEQYLGASENALTISSLGNNRSNIDIGIGTADHEQQNASGMLHANQDLAEHTAELIDHNHNAALAHHNHQQQHHQQQQLMDVTHQVEASAEQQLQTRDEDVVGDMGAVWRPY